VTTPVVELRPLARADLPTLGAWLREPLVATWWCDPSDPAALEDAYGPGIDGADPTHVLVATTDGVDVGLVQWYRFADEPSYADDLAPLLAVPAGAASLDYLLGVPAARGRGVADAMVRAAVAQVRESGATCVVVPVHAANTASSRLLQRCGFSLVGRLQLEPDNPAHTRDHVVWRLDLTSSHDGGARP
jgi:aminoglycoside 6'-N-acetyltransferase